MESTKPIGRKAYGSIGHLPMSRMGPADHKMSAGQSRICTQKKRDRHDRVIIQEKLDGSCVAVALVDGVLHSLGRAGWSAISSPYLQHRLFAVWVMENEERFRKVLSEGERVVGEWLAQAHGTRYNLKHDPFVAFDIMRGTERDNYETFRRKIDDHFTVPSQINTSEPMGAEEALAIAEVDNWHGALDPIEGVVFRVERHGAVDFLAKFVRPDKVDGCFLPEVSGKDAIWNWYPKNAGGAA